MNHREIIITAGCILALIATTADASGCRGKAKQRDECREPAPEPEPTPQPEPEPTPESKEPTPKPEPKKRALEARDNGPSADDTPRVRTKVYCPEPKKSLITDQRYLGGKYGPEKCCVEAVSRLDARKTCRIVWGKK